MLELRNITKVYKSKRGGECRALTDVSLVFPDKGLVFVCGKSGSGKSTLLNIASGMDAADGGELIIDGKSSAEFKQSDYDVYRNAYAGYIFQDFGLIDELNVKDNISLALELRGDIPPVEQIDAALKSVGLEGYGERKSFELSGGQRQRVSIARALIKNPKIVFADEPTGNLDATTGKQIFELFKKLSASRLVVIISHDEEGAVYYGDRVITLSDGAVLSDLTKTGEIDTEAAKAKYRRKIDEAFDETKIQATGETASAFNRVKTNFPLLRAVKMGILNFKTRKIRFIFTCFLSVIALAVFCLADIMRNYDARTASVNTYKNLNIDTLLLVRNSVETDENGNELKIPVEFGQTYIDKITQEYAAPYKAYAVSIKFTPYASMNEDDLSENEKIFEKTVGMLVETAEEFTETTLKGFYGATLKIGRYPKRSKNAVEILISDFTADGIMFYGAKFDNGDIIPNSGYESILGAYFDNSGITFKIVGVFGTDYKNTAYSKERKLEYKFNLENIYTAALTTKNALYENAAKNDAVPTVGYFDAGGNYANYELIAAEKAKIDNVFPFFGTAIPLVYKGGYNSWTALNDGEIIISKELLDALLQKNGDGSYIFEKVKPSDFENLAFNLTLLDQSRAVSFADLKIVGVFDGQLDFGVFPGLADINIDLSGVILTNNATKNLFLEKTLAVACAYLPLSNGADAQKKLLGLLDGESVSYLTYAAPELETMNLLFKVLSQILGGVSLILFLFVMLLTLNFISASVASKQKEIGIIRAMGARGIDAAKIFIIEGAAVFVISLVLSVLLSVAGVAVLNVQLTSMFANPISVLSLTPLTFIIAALGNALIITVGSLIPLVKITKMKPIDAVKTVH